MAWAVNYKLVVLGLFGLMGFLCTCMCLMDLMGLSSLPWGSPETQRTEETQETQDTRETQYYELIEGGEYLLVDLVTPVCTQSASLLQLRARASMNMTVGVNHEEEQGWRAGN